MGFYFVAHQTHAPPAPSSAAPTLSSSQRRSGSVPQRRSSAPSPTRAQARSQGSDLLRVGGSPSAASSDGGAVPGSAAAAAASAAPPPASRQSPRALASVLRAPAGDPAIMAHRGHLDGLTAQAPALMHHGSFAAGKLSSHSPLQSSSTLEMLENKLAMQTAEVEKLIMENQRLASSHVVLRQDIVDTEKEMQMIRTHLGEVQTETDLQIRDLLERIRLMEADIHSGDAVKKELHQVHMEAKRLITERQMLTLDIENVIKELQKLSASGDGKSLPELLAELDGLRKEHHNLRSQFEFEKNTNIKQVEQMRTMEMNLITMTKQAEKLRGDVANAERRAQAAAAQAAAHAAGAQVTASQPGQLKLQRFQQQLQTHMQVHMPVTPRHISREPRLQHISREPRLRHISREPRLGHISREPRLGHISREPRLGHISREPRLGHISTEPKLGHISKETRLEHTPMLMMLPRLTHMQVTLAIQAMRKVQCPIIPMPYLRSQAAVQLQRPQACMAQLVVLDILLRKFSRAVPLQMQRNHLLHHRLQHHILAHMTKPEEPRGENL
ncbi:LOW QUALITY PROTEIN: polyglutamine-repeat protein pqn-41 [Sorghum bicolor]|uniref:LOW QUALITY PROTEIN: polyglutamine-repeat protein pqn-41 n=1 Tax=Sorghum bicolor TaxID=4558 RepID=UPI000B4255D6|nr:LOW QUALITY PROTEIN: polyglutamine-repeat protein pqn-41 [Sorghum bicolor]|eukprot:XP_021319478.1 LOW QUALITY PROTEIN: polyglutamine-repeat protein pqn-41 [Sorghum bicolor]